MCVHMCVHACAPCYVSNDEMVNAKVQQVKRERISSDELNG